MDFQTKLINLSCAVDVVSIAVNRSPAGDEELAESLGGCIAHIAAALDELCTEVECHGHD